MSTAIVAERVGHVAFNAIVDHVPWPETLTDEEKRRIVSSVLMAAIEYAGVRVPLRAFGLNVKATVKAFPDGPPALTAQGLSDFYERRGWRFFVLRVGPLVRAFTGQTERLQEMLALYEERCTTEGVEPVPPWADGPYVAGGDKLSSPFALMLDGGGK